MSPLRTGQSWLALKLSPKSTCVTSIGVQQAPNRELEGLKCQDSSQPCINERRNGIAIGDLIILPQNLIRFITMETQRNFQTLTGKVAIITGASRGLGAGFAYELAKRGAKVTKLPSLVKKHY
jgi:3-oxoacyl-ACP reductase-like protein